MPNGWRRFPVQVPTSGAYPAWLAGQSAVLANTLYTNGFRMLDRSWANLGIRLGGWGFQKLKKSLREAPGFDGNKGYFCASHKLLDCFCALHYIRACQGAGNLPAGQLDIGLGKELYHGQG